MDTNCTPPIVIALDDADDPSDVIDAMALGPFIASVQPFARTQRLSRVRADARLLPPGIEPTLVADGPRISSILARGDGWTLRCVRWRDKTAEIMVTAATDRIARQVIDACTDGAFEPTTDDGAVAIGFWHQTRTARPKRVERQVAVETWSSVRRNYSHHTADALDGLMATDPSTAVGRVVLLHGPPGTGKTTALRAVAHAWRAWCCTEVILDPEKLFDDPEYLMTAVLGDDEECDDDRRHRLLVLEDCDELIGAEAKRASGQSLARLLNLTDGILGQGLEVLVAITTNEPVAALHPAVVRPGRCLADIYVGALSRSEAETWLGRSDGIPAVGATIAELFNLRAASQKLEVRSAPVAVGQYL